MYTYVVTWREIKVVAAFCINALCRVVMYNSIQRLMLVSGVRSCFNTVESSRYYTPHISLRFCMLITRPAPRQYNFSGITIPIVYVPFDRIIVCIF